TGRRTSRWVAIKVLLASFADNADRQQDKVIGTIGYMSPEQVLGRAADSRSDVFSFGAILHELLTGRQVFRRGSAVETMNAILKEDPTELSEFSTDLPAGVEAVVRRCLEKSAEERFQSSRDLGFHLEAVCRVGGTRPAAVS